MPEWLGANCPGARDARVGRFSCFLFNARTLFCRATICRRVCQPSSATLTVFTLTTEPRTRTYDLFVIPELEVVLHHLVFIPVTVHERNKVLVGKVEGNALLDVVFVKVSFLDLIKVPRDDVLSRRSHNRVLLLVRPHVEPKAVVC